MSTTQIRDALRPVGGVVAALLELSEHRGDDAAVAARCLFAVQILASHHPDDLRELDAHLLPDADRRS